MSPCDLWTCCAFTGIILVSLAVSGAQGTDTIYMQCDPSRPNADCPAGYCCVKDEFDDSQVYCERMGQVGEACSVQPTLYDCPCLAGLTCRPNVHTAVFTSMFGRCSDPSSP